MNPEKDDLDHMIDQTATWLGQPIEEEWRPGIRQHLQAARVIVEDVLTFDLSDHAEPAPVFTP